MLQLCFGPFNFAIYYETFLCFPANALSVAGTQVLIAIFFFGKFSHLTKRELDKEHG
jgi:hypothetical protein